ncbi:hypothetical protein A9239_02290 [Methanosarcina sp. A14]|nr:hypothetical protein A9239_02290 [Methanosarcina sp. A14]
MSQKIGGVDVFDRLESLQEECCILGLPCVTLWYNTEKPDTIKFGANLSQEPILMYNVKPYEEDASNGKVINPFGNGRAGERIIQEVLRCS